MKYLKKYNETVDSNSELANLIELNLEDNGLFEVVSIKIPSNGYETLLCMNQNYVETTDQTLIDLRNNVEQLFLKSLDFSNVNDMLSYTRARVECDIYMKDSTTKLIERIGKKYDFEIIPGNTDLFELNPHTNKIYYYQCSIKY